MRRRSKLSWVLLVLCTVSLGAASASPGPQLMYVSRSNLCVTEGAIEELPGRGLSVTAPKMRAYLNAFTPQLVEAQFTYLGSTGNEARLGSGELRRQFGLKLRAQDACNLVYAMWHIEPESKLVVSIKSNLGEHTSTQCGNRGYRNIKPRRNASVPVLRFGDVHILRAEMNGEEIESLRRQRAGLGRASRPRCPRLRWAGRNPFRQRPLADRTARRQASYRAGRTRSGVPVRPG